MNKTADITTVTSRKGGVGKSFISQEIAYVLGANLLDLETEDSSVTTLWGYRADNPSDRPEYIARAIANKTVPLVLTSRKPHLIPSHPNLAGINIDSNVIANHIMRWHEEWNTEAPKHLVIDTHPGANPLANAALAVADNIVIPTRLSRLDLIAVQQLVRELEAADSTAKIIIAPNFLKPTTSRKRQRIITRYLAPVLDINPNILIADGLPDSTRISDRDQPSPITQTHAKDDKPIIDGINNIVKLITQKAGN